MNKRRSPVVSGTVESIRTIINESVSEHLPPVRKLALQCTVSPVTVLRAIAILESEGLIEGGWGKRYIITAKKKVHSQLGGHPKMTTIDKTLSLLKNDFAQGKYPTHRPLPPMKHLAAQYNVSYPSLRKTLALLGEENIIKRSGTRYCFFTDHVKQRPTIAIVAFGSGRNSVKIITERERSFYRFLSTVATDNNVHIETVCCNDYLKTPQFYTPDDTPLTEFLKKRTIAGIVLSSYHMKDSAACLRSLLTFNIPISAWVEDHRILKMIGRYGVDRKKTSFFDSSYSTIPGLEVGNYLIGKGHRNIAYISPFHESPWSQNRLTGLKRAAAKVPGTHVYPFVCTEYLNDYFYLEKVLKASSFEKHCSVGEIEDNLHPFLRSKISSIKYEHDILLRDNLIFTVCKELIEEAVNNRSITAWVCANDHVAALINGYWNHASVPLAERPVLVGFDNSFESFEHNFTSYEFNTHGEIQQMLNHLLYPDSLYRLSSKPAIRLSGRVVERA